MIIGNIHFFLFHSNTLLNKTNLGVLLLCVFERWVMGKTETLHILMPYIIQTKSQSKRRKKI